MPDEEEEELEGGGRVRVWVGGRSAAVEKSRSARLRWRWIVCGEVGVGAEWRRSVCSVHWPVNLLGREKGKVS